MAPTTAPPSTIGKAPAPGMMRPLLDTTRLWNQICPATPASSFVGCWKLAAVYALFMAISTVMGRARSMRPSAIIRPLWSTTTAVTATSSCAAWACALRTIWIAFSPGIAIGSGPPERGGDYPPCARGTQSAHFPLARIRPGRHSRAGRGERTPMDKTTDTLARYVTSLRYHDLSPRAVREAKRHLIDSLGCAMGGHGSEPAVIARRLAPEWNGASSARLLGVGRPTTPEAAAFANSAMIRFLDANDTYIARGSGHPSDMLGALLAAAECQGASGKDLLLALVAGYEVFGALADQISLRDRGWDQGVFVAPAAAAGAGLLLGLSATQMAEAIAIAATANVATRQTRAGALSMWKGCATAAATKAG